MMGEYNSQLTAQIPVESMVADSVSYNTPQNAKELLLLARKHHWKRVLIVINPSQAARAWAFTEILGDEIEHYFVLAEHGKYGDCSKWFLRSRWIYDRWNRTISVIPTWMEVRKIKAELAA